MRLQYVQDNQEYELINEVGVLIDNHSDPCFLCKKYKLAESECNEEEECKVCKEE